MRKSMVIMSIAVFASAAFAATNPADRWAAAVGGRAKVGAIKSIYREATIEVSGFEGTIKAWHTPEGRYRKEAPRQRDGRRRRHDRLPARRRHRLARDARSAVDASTFTIEPKKPQ